MQPTPGIGCKYRKAPSCPRAHAFAGRYFHGHNRIEAIPRLRTCPNCRVNSKRFWTGSPNEKVAWPGICPGRALLKFHIAASSSKQTAQQKLYRRMPTSGSAGCLASYCVYSKEVGRLSAVWACVLRCALKSAFSGVQEDFQAPKMLFSDSPTPKTGCVVLGFETPSVTRNKKKTEKTVFFAFSENFLCFSLKI